MRYKVKTCILLKYIEAKTPLMVSAMVAADPDSLDHFSNSQMCFLTSEITGFWTLFYDTIEFFIGNQACYKVKIFRAVFYVLVFTCKIPKGMILLNKVLKFQLPHFRTT